MQTISLAIVRATLSFSFMLLGAAASGEEVDLLIVAGQSNAVGYDARPSELPRDDADANVLFWWRAGDPPPDDHDSTSGRRWKHLQPQPLGNPKRPKQGRQYGNFAQPEGGFGPEIGLARTLYGCEKTRLAVVKVAFSGTSMRRDWNPSDAGEGGSCYRALVSEVRAAVAAAKSQGVTLRTRALAWVQGESDANANDADKYSERLGEMIAALRRDLAAPELIALIAVNTRFGGGRNAFIPTIIDQQRRLASRDPRVEYVDTSAATVVNDAHYDAQGTLQIGQWFADALLAIETELQPEKRHFTIVTLGDSITKGVRGGVTSDQTFASLVESDLRQHGYSTRVINVGIGGERTDQALKRLQPIIGLKPDIVTVMYGTNDSYVDQGNSASRITLEAYRHNLNTIVAELLSRGIQPVLMTEPRWADDARVNGLGENPNVRLEPYVMACRETANRWHIPMVDHFANWTESRKKGVNLRQWTTDGCHPNPVGHRKIATAMSPVFQKILQPRSRVGKKLLSGGSVRVVCFGDSVTGVYYHTGSRRAYTDMLAAALRRVGPRADVEMINAGISGHTTVNALERIDRDVLRHKPDVVTVMFGLNDMTRVPLEEYRSNLHQIVTKCRRAGAEVILATPNNVISTGGRPSEKLVRYCDAVRQIGHELKVPVCDVYRELAAVRDCDSFDWRLLMSDEIHPNMDGHKRIATALAQTLTGFRISLDDVAPPQPVLAKTKSVLRGKKTLRILAMQPIGDMIKPIFRDLIPETPVSIESWPVETMTLAEIENDAKACVRKMKPDLVIIAVPRDATADTDEAFAKSYAWIMNWSLNFGPPTWDCVVVHPSVFAASDKQANRDMLIRRLVRAQDLSSIDRPSNNRADAPAIIREWFEQRITSVIVSESNRAVRGQSPATVDR